MDTMAKLIPRKQFMWQGFFQAKKSLYTAPISSLSQRPLSRSITYQTSITSSRPNLTAMPSKLSWNQSLIAHNRMMYSSEAPPSSDKQQPSEEKLADSEVAEKVNEEMASEESPNSETPVVSKSQTGEPLPSEQEETDADNKLDKLYKVIELEVLAYEPSVLDSYQWFVVSAATHLGIKVGKCWSPMTSNKLRFPLLKSAFVHKKHQVQYEVRTHHRFLTFHKLTSSTADTFLEYIERNIPEGVGLKVTRVEAKAIPDYLQKDAQQQ